MFGFEFYLFGYSEFSVSCFIFVNCAPCVSQTLFPAFVPFSRPRDRLFLFLMRFTWVPSPHPPYKALCFPLSACLVSPCPYVLCVPVLLCFLVFDHVYIVLHLIFLKPVCAVSPLALFMF